MLAAALLVLAFGDARPVTRVAAISGPPPAPVLMSPDPRPSRRPAALISGAVFAVWVGERRRRLRRAGDRRLRELADAALEGLVIHAGGRIRNANGSFAALVGRPLADLIGAPLALVLPTALPAEAATRPAWGQGGPVEIALRRPDGGTVVVEALSRQWDGAASVLAVRDITGRSEAEARIRYLAMHDPLTELANRRLFEERLATALSEVRRGGTPVALHYLDLDRFKEINDEFGHGVGDALLCEVAGRLRATCREVDLVARLGGDEFAILQAGPSDPGASAALARRLLAALAEPFLVCGHVLVPGGSIGIATAPLDAIEPEALVRAADRALYRAKVDGRGTFRAFHAAPDPDRRRREERAFGERPTSDHLRLLYQPIIDCLSGQVVGLQAIPRWVQSGADGTEGDEVALPARWGLADELGYAAIARACDAASTWPEHLFVAVSLAPRLLRSGAAPRELRAALAKAGLRPERLLLEVSQASMVNEEVEVLEALRGVRALGVKVSLDGFGAGYSSLACLQRFPLDELRIDRGFIATLAEETTRLIVRAVVQLARSLAIVAAADGVETEGQLEWLRELGCERAQGPLLAPPRPLAPGQPLEDLWPRARFA